MLKNNNAEKAQINCEISPKISPKLAPILQIAQDEYIPISPDTKKPEADTWHWLPHQISILSHLFSGLPEKRMAYDTAIWSCPKKGGKTGLAGAVGHGWARTQGGEIYFVANSKEQSEDRSYKRIENYLAYLKQHSIKKYNKIVLKQYEDAIEYREPYAILRPIPCSASSQAGSFASLSIWDEIWGYDLNSLEILWSEFSPIPQLFGATLRLCVTYAGYRGKSNLLWNLYSSGVGVEELIEGRGNKISGLENLPVWSNGSQLTYWDHEHRTPWVSAEFLAARRRDPSVRPSDFRRLWQNEWTAGEEEFISPAVYQACVAAGRRAGLRNSWASLSL